MESISRLSGILESARELTLDAAREVRRNPTEALSTPQLRKLLDSRHEAEVLDGLRRVIALSSRPPAADSRPVLFSAVLKNIASPSVAVKKLVYLYLLQHAESEPDTALLAINTIQKTLSASDPHLRALALRVMSSIRVPVISQIVALGIKRGCADMSPLVRRAAALAMPKCRRLDPNTEPQLLDHLNQLLGDRQYIVAGAAVLSFMEMCPDRIDLIHKHYRSLVRKLVDMDEWAQLATLRLMTQYSRLCFPRPAHKNKSATVEHMIDPDLSLLLRAAQSLLQSRNAAVITSVARLYLYVAPEESGHLLSAVGPLMSLLRSPAPIQQIALHSIVQVALALPQPFARYASRFLVRSSDPPSVCSLKLELLTIIFPHCADHVRSLVLAELVHFATAAAKVAPENSSLSRDAVRAIGRCAQVGKAIAGDQTSTRCLHLLLSLISDGKDADNADLVAEALIVVRHLIQANPAAHVGTVTRLAKSLDVMTSPRARASTIWLIGEFSGMDQSGGGNIAADVLRILAKGFADEAVEAKLQIVLLAAKVQVHNLSARQDKEAGTVEENRDGISLLWDYILLLARYDTSYDLRDRARVYRALLSSPTATQLASLLLLAPKPVPQAPSPSESRRGFTLGSASSFIGADIAGAAGLPGYTAVPEWVKPGDEPDPNLRNDVELGSVGVPLRSAIQDTNNGDTAHDRGQGLAAHKSAPAKEKSLDDWLAEEDGAANVDETSASDDEESGSDVSGSEESEDDDDDDDDEDDDGEESEGDERARLVQ